MARGSAKCGRVPFLESEGDCSYGERTFFDQTWKKHENAQGSVYHADSGRFVLSGICILTNVRCADSLS